MARGTAALAAVALTGCTATGGTGGGGEATLQVLAAASLTDVYTELGQIFEAGHDGVTVEFSFGSSTELAQQAADGAPGDVLATADEAAMAIAGDAGVTVDPAVFATNTLVIVTPPGNPAGVESLGDLAGTTWVRCADEAPCGKAAVELLERHGVTARPASLEEEVRATLDKVAAAEADAGLVYATDAVAAGGDVTTVEIEGAQELPNPYLVAALEQSGHPDLAQDWIELVTGPGGRAELSGAGFGEP